MNAAITAWLRAKCLGVVPAEAIPYDNSLAHLREQARLTVDLRADRLPLRVHAFVCRCLGVGPAHTRAHRP
jgi:hypothetical protein